MALLALTALGTAAIAGGPGQEPEQADPGGPGRRPDVLLILLDDVNDWVGHLGGHPAARTPAIDRLARRGVAFTNAHCPSPVCRPSRTAVLSGLRPSTTLGQAKSSWVDMLDEPTLTAHFSAHGYRTLGAGKIYHGSNALAFDQYHPGQDRFLAEALERAEGVSGVDSGDGPRKFTGLETDIGNDDAFDWAAIDAEDSKWRDHDRAGWTVKQLMKDSDEPIFLAVGFRLPHLPWYVPKSYFDLHDRADMVLPEVLAGDKRDLPAEARNLIKTDRVHDRLVEADLWPDAIRAYLASVSFVDAQVGRLLDALDASPRRDRTIVVMASDHGWHLGEKGHWRKATLWEPSTRIPFVVSVPAELGGLRGVSCAKPVDSLSIYATLCELTGLPTPAHVEGPSLVPLLEDPEAPWSHLALTTLRNHDHSVRSERFRYTRYRGGGRELYDLVNDPQEFTNLVEDPEHAGTVRRLDRQLDRMVTPAQLDLGSDESED